MSITYNLRRAIGKSIPSVNSTIVTEKYGFPLAIEKPHEEWKEILEEMMPLFEEVGWLDGMTSISIKPDCVPGCNIGHYINGSVAVEYDAHEYSADAIDVVEFSQRFVLTHEVLHHAHLYVNEYDISNKLQHEIALTEKEETLVEEHVSNYAATNQIEAIAEIGAAIIFGYDFPEEIYTIYKKYDGPDAVYDIRDMRE